METTDTVQLRRLNLMHTLLSRINRAIVRAENPDGLYLDVCRIAVESGLFDLAWVGLLDLSGQLRPMACWGDTHNVVPQLCSLAASETLSTSLRDHPVLICNPLSQDPQWCAAGLAGSGGLAAMGRFTLHEHERVVGLLALYSAEAGLFDPAVIALAEEVAGDLAFALGHLQQEQQRLALESKIHYLAYYDPQTGLPSRPLLEQRLTHMALNNGAVNRTITLFDIKLQRLEAITRVVGHAAVDEMLCKVAQRLEAYCGGDGLVAQLGPAEFAVVISGLTDHAAVDSVARQLRQRLSEALVVGWREVFLSSAIGVACYPQDESQVLNLPQRARVAAEHAMCDGEAYFYHAELDRDSEERLNLESDLHRALERGEFELHYQPQLNLKTGAMVGVEALLRWRHPEQGLVGPNQFIPVLEDSGLMVPVGVWVLRTACAQNRAWQDAGLPPLLMAVNLSALQFRVPGLVDTVTSALNDSGLAPEWLELELTESLIMENAECTIATMHALKRLGLTLSLDDFGTGYSSLSYLRRFPVDRIKIDQSFVRDIATSADSAALARTILTMAHNLGMSTIAEGVEETIQLNYLRKHACETMQGFLFSQAVPPDTLAQCLRDERKLAPSNGTTLASSTVLAVDDEPGILAALKRTLRRDGLTVLTANSAQEGFDILANNEVGLIISDQRMAGISGTEFLNQVKGLYPDPIRILLSGYTDLEVLLDAINRGALYKVLTKPWDDSLLRENVHEALQRFETVEENRRLSQRLEASGLDDA